MSNNNSIHYFLRGGGEMGELIRAKDWSKTSLGDPASWPQSLCTMVAVMLDNPFAMYIAWGNEFIQLYNDGYRPILGASKHPQALGIGTQETFSEIWHIIGSMFEGVMNGKAVGYPDLMLPLDRNGYVEECYFDFSYSPIRKDDGEVGGVLVTVIETTEKKRAAKSLNESNSRYINNILQTPIAMCIFRGKNHVVEIANEKMLNLWGKNADQVMYKPIFEGLPEAKDQGLEELIDKVYTTGEKFVANERPVNLLKDGKVETKYLNFVYDAFKEIDGTISGIVATATDVTPQVVARSRVEESEQKVRALVKNAPFPIAVYVGKEMIIELANPSIINIWGKGNDVIGKSFKDLLPELDNQLVFEQIEKVFTTGESFHTQNTPLNLNVDGDLHTFYFNYSLNPLYDVNGNIYGVMNTGVDLTELNIAKKRIEESDKRFRNTMKQAPVGITILRGPQYIVEMANDAYLQLVDKKEAEFVGNSIFTSLPEVQESVQLLLDSVLNTGVPYHGNEVAIPINRYGKQSVFYFDFLYYPLKEEDGKISGVIATVTEVTEKVEARKKIEEKKRLYETITENTPDFIYVFDLNYRFTYANEALLNMWGRTWENSIEKGMLELGYEPWHAQMHEQEIDQVIATKKPIRGEVSFPHARLGKRLYDYIFAPVIDQNGKVEAIAGTTRDITPQVEARKLIEESEKRFRNMVQQAPVAISILRGENFVVEVANEKQLQLWGKTKEQVMDKPIFTALPEAVGQGLDEILNRVFTTGKPFIADESPIILIRNDKSETIYLNFVYEPLYDNNHHIDGVLSVAVEITEQVISRKKIEESEERFRSLAQALPQLSWVTDEKGISEFASYKWKEYSGIEPGGEKEWKAIVHPDDYDNINAAWIHSLNTGDFYKYDVRLLSKNGEYRWHTVNGEPIFDKENKIVKWVGAFTEIHAEKTFSKELEEKVITRTAELKASEEKFYNLFNFSPICKTLSDASSGKIVMVNDAFTKLFGYSREDTLNKTFLELELLDPDTLEIMVHELQANRKIENMEIGFIKKSGERFVALASAEAISLGNKQFFLCAFNDISEIKKAEQNMEQKNMELEKMNKELESFAYISSHDLQEPLRKIQTFTSRILEKEENNLSDYGKDMFNRMQNSAKRMQILIQDLLAYSRTNTSERKLETTDLNKIIAEIKEELKDELKEKKATIDSNQLHEADVIPFQFRQLMVNLITNSLKYSNPDIPPHIQIKSEFANGEKFDHVKLLPKIKYCHITVSDNGIGFKQQYSEKIFEIFQRLHGRTEYTGTGIGLSIVKKIVDNHNGIITATGELNKGATFDIYFPIL